MRFLTTKKIFSVLLLVCCLLSFVSCTFSFSNQSYVSFSELTDSAPLLPDNAALPKNDDCEYVSDYLAFWGMPSYRPSKVIAIEKYYERYFIGTLPDVYAIAAKVYTEYRTLYASNESFDSKNPDNVTGAIISAYQRAAGDRYAVYMTPAAFNAFSTNYEADYVGIGVYIEYNAKEGHPVVLTSFEGSPAAEAGIRTGDIIKAINGIGITTENRDEALAALKGKVGESVTVTVERAGEAQTHTLIFRQIDAMSVSWRLLEQDSSIAYVKIEEFNKKTPAQFKTAIDRALQAGATSFIFDVRDNPGGESESVKQVLDYLVEDGQAIFHVRYKEGSELEAQNTSYYANDSHSLSLTMTVLCNRNTASAGELFAVALQDYGMATVVGETTYGKGTIQNIILLADGSAFTISTGRFDSPLGNNGEGVGVIPNIEVTLPSEVAEVNAFLRPDRDDTQLQAAVDAIYHFDASLPPLV